MVGWSGRRKFFTILFFTFPTLLGILIFSVYPITVNTYISFTNRNKSHPNPDCEAGLNNIMVPTCWPMFREKAPKGLGTPYGIIEPWYKNYADVMGTLFSPEAGLALLSLVVAIVPLALTNFVDQRLERQIPRPISSSLVWIVGILVVVVLGWLLQVPKAFSTLMETGDFLVVVLRTLIFVVLRVPFSFVMGLVLALILNSNYLKGRTFFRVALFVPWAASSMAILMALVWQFFFREQGTINAVLTVLGLPTKVWLNDPVSAFAAIVVTDVWFSYSFYMVVILGALQSVPAEVYEAAEMDGAGWWRQLISITLPLIRPAILPATVLTSITAFQMFGTAYAITGGGPGVVGKPGATEFVMVYAFKQIFQTQNYGRATAFAVIIFLMLFSATLFSNRYLRITKGAYE